MKFFFSFSIFVLLFTSFSSAQIKQPKSDSRILEIIEKHRPMLGAPIPANIKDRLGATHVGGKYYFTKKPYLIEGSEQLYSLGFGVIKLWFYKTPGGYQYNSDWNLKKDITLKELAQHPYYKEALEIPYSTIALSTSADRVDNNLDMDKEGLKNEEKEYYELTKYLLEHYKEREVNFILHNWEGDWILRSGPNWGAQWGRVKVPDDVELRLKKMQYLFQARQEGVTRARSEVTKSKANVFHAIEVNKVIDSMYGVPSLTTGVLPFVETDMVSWSAYDGTDFDKTGLDLFKGIDFIRGHMKLTGAVEKKDAIFIGEIGIPEMATKNTPQEFRERWDKYLAVVLAQNIPFMIQWELFCNEAGKGVSIVQPDSTRNNRDLNGFWLIRPDGTKSYAMEYFDAILTNAGGKYK